MSKRRYTVETLAAGQPRPYADHRWHYHVTFEWQDMAGFKDKDAPFILNSRMGDDAARAQIKNLVGGWCEKGEGNWADRRLSHFQNIGPGKWEVIITSPFTD